jgi:hypothetical protein
MGFVWLMLFNELVAVYSENCVKPVNLLHGKNAELLFVKRQALL